MSSLKVVLDVGLSLTGTGAALDAGLSMSFD
jgi:hypothetical protein